VRVAESAASALAKHKALAVLGEIADQLALFDGGGSGADVLGGKIKARFGNDLTGRRWQRLVATPEYDAWLIQWGPDTNVEPHDHGGSAGDGE
jgi:hypothetical protein